MTAKKKENKASPEKNTDSVAGSCNPEAEKQVGPGGELEALRELAAQREKEALEWKTKLLYEKAELDNFRKRSYREKMELREFLRQDILASFLRVIDNLERALEHATSASKESLEEGIRITLSEFRQVFASHGAKPFASLGEKFNPDLHEAVDRKADAEKEENTVTNEYLKGYMLGDRLLRPAKVTVAFRPVQEVFPEPAVDNKNRNGEEN